MQKKKEESTEHGFLFWKLLRVMNSDAASDFLRKCLDQRINVLFRIISTEADPDGGIDLRGRESKCGERWTEVFAVRGACRAA